MILSMLAGLGGVTLIVLHSEAEGSDPFRGTMLILAATLCWAGASSYVADRCLTPTLGNLSTQALVAALMMALIATTSGEWEDLRLDAIDAGSWAGLLFVAVLASVFAYQSYQRLLSRFPASLVVTNTYVNPFVGVVVGAVILGERLSPASMAGGVLILVAVILASRTRGPTAPAVLR